MYEHVLQEATANDWPAEKIKELIRSRAEEMDTPNVAAKKIAKVA